MPTERYNIFKEYLNKSIEFYGEFSKFSTDDGHDQMVCLSNIFIGEKFIIDHVWIPAKQFKQIKKLKIGKPFKIKGVFTTRKRPADSIFEEPKLDIRMKEKSIKIVPTEKR